MNTCKRTCCWNPYGLCSRKQNCACHLKAIRDAAHRERTSDLDRAASLNRGKR